MNSGIYKLANKINGNFYIGQTVDFGRRKKEHFCLDKKKKGNVLGRAIRKHGIPAFEFVVLERCAIEELDSREMFYILTLAPAYNMNTGGRGNAGHSVSLEIRKVISEKAKANWEKLPQETKMRIVKNGMTKRFQKGHIVPQERREKLRAMNIGRPTSDLQKQRAREVNQILKIGNTFRQRSVYQINLLDKSIMAEFPMAKTAALVIGRSLTGITKVCKGVQKSCGGFGWRYVGPESVETISQESRAISSLEAQSNRLAG